MRLQKKQNTITTKDSNILIYIRTKRYTKKKSGIRGEAKSIEKERDREIERERKRNRER